jgi:hypothetical protein
VRDRLVPGDRDGPGEGRAGFCTLRRHGRASMSESTNGALTTSPIALTDRALHGKATH